MECASYLNPSLIFVGDLRQCLSSIDYSSNLLKKQSVFVCSFQIRKYTFVRDLSGSLLSLGYLRDILGISWGYLGDILGISLGYLGDILEIS